MAAYEFWLTDDGGNRFYAIQKIFFATYTRPVFGIGSISLGMSFEEFGDVVKPFFKPDWRVEVWRSAAHGIPMRREDVYLLRKPSIYTREDNVQVIQFYGRNGIDLLYRRWVIQRLGTSYAKKTGQVDDVMKSIVREQMLYGSALDKDGVVDNTRAWPQNEFTVQADGSVGPTVSRTFAGRMVFDIVKDLSKVSIQKNRSSSSDRKIYFDVVPKQTGLSAAPLGWEFQTFADLRGSDRTLGPVFSMENENISNTAYSISHLDEINSVYILGAGKGKSQIIESVQDMERIQASRWNRVEKVISASSETTTDGLQDAGEAELNKRKPKEEMVFTFLNTPGGVNTPRSLYGVDWDLGDLVRVNYAGKQFTSEILTIYVSIDDAGKETVTGRNVVQ